MANQDKSNQKGDRSRGRRNADRPRPLPPDVTARNLAYEKERRRALNDDFVTLARLVPALAGAKRLNKNLIVRESIQHLQKRRDLCIAAARDMQRLLAENERLRSEANVFRGQRGQAAGAPDEPFGVTEAMAQLMDVENEASSQFPPGFGDNWAGRPQSGSSPLKRDGSRGRDQVAASSPGESDEQSTHIQVPQDDLSVFLNESVSHIPGFNSLAADPLDTSCLVQHEAPLSTAAITAFRPPNTVAAPVMPPGRSDEAILEAPFVGMESSITWPDEMNLPLNWPLTPPQHLDFPDHLLQGIL